MREIWLAAGKPNAYDRADNAKRVQCLLACASAKHIVWKTNQKVTLSSLQKSLSVYTGYAWKDDENGFAHLIKMCKDYEEGSLHFSVHEEKMWKKHAKEKRLNVLQDVCENQRRLKITWLKPLLGLTKNDYNELLERCCAGPIIEGNRGDQYLYSDGETKCKSGTMAYAMDKMQRCYAVQNAFRLLLICGSTSLFTIYEFLKLDVAQFANMETF